MRCVVTGTIDENFLAPADMQTCCGGYIVLQD